MKKLTENFKDALKIKDLSFELARKLDFKKSLGCISTILLLVLIGCQATQTFAQTCSTAPANLVSWYRGENNTIDFISTNNGTIQGNVTYTTGYVGQTFNLGGTGNTSGSGDRVLVGNPANFQLQDFTIEGWIKRSSNTIVTNSPVAGFEGGSFFAYGAGGYGFIIQQSTNRIGLTKIGTSAVYSNLTVSDTNFHHVAVTKSGNQVTFYVDGVADAPITYNTTFTFGTNAAIGARGDNDARNAFFGSIDELSIYSRSLAASEIQTIVAAGSAGKCFMVNTFTVTNTNNSGAGSLRQAILDANAATGADAINFDAGVFSTPQTITLTSGELLITNSVNSTVIITGPGANLLTVSGNNASRIFTISETPVVSISGMTMTGGNGVGSIVNNNGGAILNFGDLTLNNVIITGNSAVSAGGGIVNSLSDSLTVNNSTISNNTTTGNAGGVYSDDSSTLTVTGSTINGNTASGFAGGIAVDSATFTLTNSTVSNNTATTSVGGGITFDIDSTATITGSTISGNTAANNSGGGIHLQPDSNNFITITNSTVSGNTAANGGGIFRVANATLTVTLSYTTVANNTATATGGGINGTMNLGNTIVGNNTAATSPDYAGTLNSNGYNLIENITGATIGGNTATNITGADPILGALQNNGGATFTHALLPGSPAIDKGESSGATSDQRVQTRPVDNPSIPNAAGGDGADIGAFEDQPIVMFSAANYTVNEPSLTATITVLRSGGTNGVDTVQYSTVVPAAFGLPPATGGANCTDGVDFINTSGTLTFAEGVASQTFTVTICNDTLVETDEFVTLELSNPSGKTLGTPSSAVLRIVSEDVYIPQKPFADFDGDGKTDLAVFRPNADPSVFDFAIRKSSDNSLIGYSWGLPGDKLAPCDYDGDGKTDVAVYREGAQSVFYIIRSSDGIVVQSNFGINGDILTVGDWDGDGKSDEAVYREGAQSYFYYRGSLNNPNRDITYLPWGTTGDKPMRGDFDGDGKQDAAIFRQSNNTWYIRNSSDGQVRIENWGIASDKFVPADYDGDGKTDLAVFRNGIWYIKQSITNQPRYVNFGLSTDTLVPADYDGDGRTDIAVYRNGVWYLMQSTNGFAGQTFGTSGDTPVPNAYINP